MGNYIVDGHWLEKRAEEVLADLKRIKKMFEEEKRKDAKGLLIRQWRKRIIERNLLKEVLKHTVCVIDQKKGGEND